MKNNLRAAMVAFDLPFAIYLAPRIAFTIPFEGKKYKFFTEDKRFLGETRHGKGQNCELREDKRGTFRYSRITFQFYTQLQPGTTHELIEEARRVTNRIIGWYRFLTKRPYMEKVRTIDLGSAMVQVQRDDGQWDGAIVATPPGGLGSSLPFDSHDIHKALDFVLKTDEDVPAHVDMLINAKDALRQENFRVAVIDAICSLEIFVELVLIKAMCTGGMSRLAAHKFLRTDRNWTISVRVKDLLREKVGLDLTQDSDLWQRWIRAKRLRDLIIHQGHSHVDINEKARDAVDLMEILIQKIEAKCDPTPQFAPLGKGA